MSREATAAGILHRGSDLLALARERYLDARRMSRYLRGLAAHRVHPDDVYISSYPRSGTTWMQLLVHLLRGGDLSFSHISEVAPWFERQLALGRRTAADFAKLARPRVFKSHLPYAWLPRGARYVYVHRDGRDVLVSYYHFYRSHLGFEGGFDEFFECFLRGDLQYRSWFRHVADFRAEAARRSSICVLSYEAMQRDPERALRSVAALCRVELTAPRTREILTLASFETMKRLEDKFDHAATEPGSRAPRGQFVRKGNVGDHRALLSPAQHAAFARALAAGSRGRLPELRLADFLH